MSSTSPDSFPAASTQPATARIRWLLIVLLVFAALAAYANSFAGVFLFDDIIRIVEEPRVQRLVPIWPLLSGERPVVDLTLALNYAVSELKPWSYHAFNLVVHVLAGLTLFGVVRRTIVLWQGRQGNEATRHGGAKGVDFASDFVAFAVALLFLVHPLQTQSVTYIIQRGESMMGLLYLLTLYCAIRAWDAPHAAGWTPAAIAACALGMATKAVMVTAPVMVLIYDFIFAPRPGVLRRRAGLYVGLCATWVFLWLCGIGPEVFATDVAGSHVGFSYQGHSAWEYALTQPGVILKYLQLSLWPAALCLDYEWPIARGAGQIIAPGVVIAALLGAAVYGLWQRHWLGFLGAWFFVILSPTSSIIPIKDVMFEHRMYLPLGAVIAAVVVCASLLLARSRRVAAMRTPHIAGLILVIALAAPLAYATHLRNRVYHSELAMWQDVVEKRPENPRGHLGIGVERLDERDYEAAIASFREAIHIEFEYASAHYNLAIALDGAGHHVDAANEYMIALQQDPTRRSAISLAALSLGKAGRHEAAIHLLEQAIEKDRENADLHYHLANALADSGDPLEARREFEQAIRLRSNHHEARVNLGNLHLREGRVEEALAQYDFVATNMPDHAVAQLNRGRALIQLQRWGDAVEAFGRVPAGDLLAAEARFGAGWALAQSGKIEDAKAAYREALALDPQHAGAAAELERLEMGSAPPP